MGRKLKVFGGNYDGRYRRIVAATSFTTAMKLARLSRDFSSETGNTEEIEIAMREPGVVWQKPFAMNGTWSRVEKKS